MKLAGSASLPQLFAFEVKCRDTNHDLGRAPAERSLIRGLAHHDLDPAVAVDVADPHSRGAADLADIKSAHLHWRTAARSAATR